MREAIDLAETWSRLAPRPGDRDEGLGKADSVPNPRRRTAAWEFSGKAHRAGAAIAGPSSMPMRPKPGSFTAG
jgi:hypothetical protein